MLLARRHRLFTVLLALCALLFSQFALAGYVCRAAEQAAQIEQIEQMRAQNLPCAESMAQAMDEDQPGLCHGHCHAPQQNVDPAQPVTLAHVAQLGPVLTVVAPIEPLASPQPQSPLLRRDAGPPLAIAHCCFRI